MPGGRIRRFNALGDYSYGVCIYALPIPQTLALLFPAMTLAAMIASSAAASIAVAIVSWKLIEERALGHKADCAAATKRLFSFGLARPSMAPLPLIRPAVASRLSAGGHGVAPLPPGEGSREAAG